MNFQFQPVGGSASRPSVSPRKKLRLGLLAVAFVLAGLAYWQYLHRLMYGKAPAVPLVVATAPAVAAPTPAPVAKPAAPMSPSLKRAADAGVMAVASYLIEAVKTTTVASPPPAVPSLADPAKVGIPTVADVSPSVAPKPTVRRPPLTRTPAERLQRAGQMALGNMLEKANKYPDAYGFGAQDLFEKAKLGQAIPIYTITAAGRENYQTGQPVKPLLKPADEWVFPVLSGNRICCMVSVKFDGRDYLPGSSSKSLALAWNKILEKWPAAEGYHPQLVVNPAIPGHYFTIPELPIPNVTDTVQMFLHNPALSPADVILASWR